MKILTRCLSEAEEKQLFGAIKQVAGVAARRDYAMFKLMRHTGMRVGTLCGLSVRDAQQALTTGTLQMRAEICKGQHKHELPLIKEIEKQLRTLLSIRRDLSIGMDPDSPLIMSRTHKAHGGISERGVQHRFVYWRRAAGLQVNVSPHWMRHTLGARSMRNTTRTDPMRTTAALLGHTNLRSTMYYTAPTRDELASALQEAS